jgi:hypothetical protein
MTGTLTIRRMRQHQSGQFAPVVQNNLQNNLQNNSLSSAFIAGLAMFGLAMNGTCLAALEQAGLAARKEAPADPDRIEESSDAQASLITGDGSRFNSDRMPRCQL